MSRTVLVVGATGIAGHHTAQAFSAAGWQVLGLSRSPRHDVPGVEQLQGDVLDPASLDRALQGREFSHVVFTTWSRQDTEDENRRVNGAMLSNLLAAAGRASTIEHVALVTGLKHYLGPFDSYGASTSDTPFRESQGRLPVDNFYYDQEDILFAEAERQGFSWSVHRPHTLIGYALGNVMNMGVTLAVYGALCRETGEPFAFPGSPEQLGGVTDLTDARLLGRHVLWSSTEPRARNEAFNTVNGEVFRWRQLWPQVAEALGVEAADYPGHPVPLEERMAHADEVWARIVERHGLAPYAASELASWWHTDADLGRQVETFADMSKSRALGFLDHQSTIASFTDLFEQLREARIIPRLG